VALIRTLRASEREALLDLLEGWELPDGWSGRAFFRRYLEQDPAYVDENVWVAEEAGRLVSCAQIFPRRLRLDPALGDVTVPVGGIGSVYTHPESRGSGVASELLRAALRAMRERGMPLSLLFASRLAFYGRLGWESWPASRLVLRRGAAVSPAGSPAAYEVAPFDGVRDAAAVASLHAAYSGARPGTLPRDTEAWQTSFRLAGNPREEIHVARRAGEALAYARSLPLYGLLQLGEVGRRDDEDGAGALAALVAHVLTPRAAPGEPFDVPGKPSETLRSLAIAPNPHDPALLAALAARGIAAQPVPDPGAMLACLDPAALARHAGVTPGAHEGPQDLLRRVLPPARFVFWVTDRF